VSRGTALPGDAASRAVLVEFCGLPGAGKSHLAGALLDGLRGKGIRTRAGDASISANVFATRRIPRKLLAAGREVLDDPAGAIRTCLAVARAERSAGDAASRSIQWLVTQRVLDLATRRGGVHVFEEGVLQALWSIGLRGDPEPLLESLEDGATPWIRPQVLVVVNAPLEVAASRLDARPSSHSRTQTLPPDERTAELRRGRELLERLVEWWRDSSDAEGIILEVANGDDGPLDREIAQLVDRFIAARQKLLVG
jgi:hypothetical protein